MALVGEYYSTVDLYRTSDATSLCPGVYLGSPEFLAHITV